MAKTANLTALATAVPRFCLDQNDVGERAVSLFGPAMRRLHGVYGNSGIRRRYSPVEFAWFAEPQGWAERNRRYHEAALDLLEHAAGRVLDLGGVGTDEIGAIVVVSTTGIATPSLDALLIERLRLPCTVERLPIFGLGCAGGAIGLARAATMAAGMPEKAVLFLVVELCTLSFRRDDPSPSNIVATALFGDGAAAGVLRSGGRGPAVAASGEYTWRHSRDVMGWEVAEDGLKAIFSRDIPALIKRDLPGVVRAFLQCHGLLLDDIDRFVCHPGGPKVIEACEQAFGVPVGALADERTVLRDFGNMSAASVLFVLERVLANDRSWRRALLTAFGPGFSAGFVLLERV
jgi:alkylresorcinol/alkylpyrone synthase